MIIDSPYIIELARGVERRLIQDGDAQLVVPPTLLVGADLVLPTQFEAATGVQINTSGTARFGLTKTNGAATDQEILRLSPGLYTLELAMVTRANYTTIGVASPDATVYISTPGSLNVFNLISAFATVGSNTQQAVSYKFMIDSVRVLRLNAPANGVGETIDVHVSVNAARHL